MGDKKLKTEEILNERERDVPESWTGPVLDKALTEQISQGTIIRTFDEAGNRLVIGLLSKRPPSEKGFIDDKSEIESNFSKNMARIGAINGAAIVMVSDRILDNGDLKGDLE